MTKKSYDTDLLRYLLRSVPQDDRDYTAAVLQNVIQQAVNPRLAAALIAAAKR